MFVIRRAARAGVLLLSGCLLVGSVMSTSLASEGGGRGGGSAKLAPGPILVSLGDSYSSGVGTGIYLLRSAECHRSPVAYPYLLAGEHAWTLRFKACAGGTISAVQNRQLDVLSRRTDVVTVGVGGNDAGFTGVLVECAKPSWMADCAHAVAQARDRIRTVLPHRLNQLYSSITTAARRATVIVVGYPRLFNGEDCNAGTFFSPQEEGWLNDEADLLDSTLVRRAAAHGLVFADPRHLFEDHAVCDRIEWVNGLSAPVEESYHPNRLGQEALVKLLDRLL